MGFFNLSNFPIEVSVPTEDLLTARWQYLVVISSLAGIVVAVLGKRRLPLYWLWFSIVFGLICACPVIPNPGGVNRIGFSIPYYTVSFFYLTGLPLLFKVCLLLFHIAFTMLIAWGLFSICPGDERPFFLR